MDPAQEDMPYPMPDAVCVRDGPWRLSQRLAGCPNARASPRRVLRRLLLGSNGALTSGRRDERALDRPTRVTHSLGKGHFLRPSDRSPRWLSPHRCRRGAILYWNALRARLANQRFNKILARAQAFAAEFLCPLLGVKRTSIGGAPMSAFDPKRTLHATV